MGTNYYFHTPGCDHCGHHPEPLHIGKSSMGWTFGLHVYPEQGINDLPDWQQRWKDKTGVIKDEYAQAITPEEMLKVICNRSREGEPHNPYWLSQNHAVLGPNGLVRMRIDGTHCVGYGAGTWDLHVGYFS